MTLYTALIVMGLLGLTLGAIIGVFVKLFKVEQDNRAELALELLPGANCGGCGKAGCADFARALAAGEVMPGNCPVSSLEQRAAIALALEIYHILQDSPYEHDPPREPLSDILQGYHDQ